MAEGVREADVVVLATPVRVILRQLSEIASLLPEDCLLMDLGSTKARIVAEMERLPEHIQPLGGHPMCGKEKSGIEVADPALYEGCTFILSPLKCTSEEALALGRALAEAVGAVPLVLEPERQDYIVATVSHLPYLLACALIATADATVSADPAAWEIVATGFRSTSRLAGSDVTMMTDILLTNREEVRKALDAYQEHLGELVRLVEIADEEKMREVLSVIRKTRREMYPASQQVIE
jgi:prephenate dehydrogenase